MSLKSTWLTHRAAAPIHRPPCSCLPHALEDKARRRDDLAGVGLLVGAAGDGGVNGRPEDSRSDHAEQEGSRRGEIRPQEFTPEEAVRFALTNNPMLQAVREQRGFAQGGVVIARTYPYNPVISAFGIRGVLDMIAPLVDVIDIKTPPPRLL